MLEFKDISVAVGDRHLFKSDSFVLNEGLVALVGRNGSGKSTLIKTILNEFNRYNGEILLNGSLISAIPKTDLAKKVAVVYARTEIFGDYTAYDIINLGRIPHQNMFCQNTARDTAVINQVAQDLGVLHIVNQSFSSLSDGERQLVMIARAFAQETDVILLDEPTAFLDVVNKSKLVEALAYCAKSQNKLILYSTHDISLLDKYCDNVLLIDAQRMKLLSSENNYLDQINKVFSIEI